MQSIERTDRAMTVKDIIEIASEQTTVEVITNYGEDTEIIGKADGKDTIEPEVLEAEVVTISTEDNRIVLDVMPKYFWYVTVDGEDGFTVEFYCKADAEYQARMMAEVDHIEGNIEIVKERI